MNVTRRNARGEEWRPGELFNTSKRNKRNLYFVATQYWTWTSIHSFTDRNEYNMRQTSSSSSWSTLFFSSVFVMFYEIVQQLNNTQRAGNTVHYEISYLEYIEEMRDVRSFAVAFNDANMIWHTSIYVVSNTTCPCPMNNCNQVSRTASIIESMRERQREGERERGTMEKKKKPLNCAAIIIIISELCILYTATDAIYDNASHKLWHEML